MNWRVSGGWRVNWRVSGGWRVAGGGLAGEWQHAARMSRVQATEKNVICADATLLQDCAAHGNAFCHLGVVLTAQAFVNPSTANCPGGGVGQFDHQRQNVRCRITPGWIEQKAKVIEIRRNDKTGLLDHKWHGDLAALQCAWRGTRHTQHRIHEQAGLARDTRSLQN